MVVSGVYKAKGFELRFVGKKVLLVTPLQSFVIYQTRQTVQMRILREFADCGSIKDLNDLMGLFYNANEEKVIELMPTRSSYYD